MPKKNKEIDNEEQVEFKEEDDEEPEGDYDSEDDDEGVSEGFKMPNVFELAGIPDTGDMGGIITACIAALIIIFVLMSVFDVSMESLGLDISSPFGGDDVAEMKVE